MFGPIGWAIDQVAGFVGDIATAGFEMIIGGLVAWVIDAVVWVVGGVFNYFIDATDPNVQADWFITGDGPYATTAAIGATLMAGFLFAGITQGVLTGDVGGMLRRIALDLPVSVLGMVCLVTVTQALIRLTDELSTWVMAGFQEDIADFGAVVASLSRLGGGVATALVVFLLGLITVLAGIVLVAELAIRAALVYIVVACSPFVFAARLWPALAGATGKLLKLLCALILSKLVIAVALAVAAAAAVGTGSGGEVTSLPEPEVMAEDPGGSVTQAVGILLSAGVAFGVAAFSPLLVARLLPLAEEAVVAQGIRGGPMRAVQQGLSTGYSIQMLRSSRLHGLASGRAGGGGAGGGDGASPGPRGGPPGAGPSGGRGSKPGGGGRSAGSSGAAGRGAAAGAGGASSGAAAAAGPVGVAVAGAAAAKGAVSKVRRTAERVAERGNAQAESASGGQSATTPGPGGATAPRPQRPPAGTGSDPSPRGRSSSGPQADQRRARPPRRPSGGSGGTG